MCAQVARAVCSLSTKSKEDGRCRQKACDDRVMHGFGIMSEHSEADDGGKGERTHL